MFQEYDRALSYIELLLNAESHNRQAIELKSVIEKRMKKDGLIGLAVLGLGGAAGVAILAGIAATASFFSRRH
uniref:Mitochondrial fission 1 protein n=1 Tax=Panagrolaimus sp. JU765 TaxID=591449 RepID=A0AC34RTE4_9BILA